MKQVSIQIPFDDEKLEALKIFLSQKDQTAEAVIGELVDGLYRKTVPLKVREYIDKRSPADTGKPKPAVSGGCVASGEAAGKHPTDI